MVVLTFSFGKLKHSVSINPPLSRQELLDALLVVFPSIERIGGVVIDGTVSVLNDALIAETLLAHPEQVYELSATARSGSSSSSSSSSSAKKAELEGSGKSRHAFKKRMAKDRLEKFWQLSATFGVENEAHHIFLQEIISDRYCILNGMQMVRDELQLSSVAASSDTGDISAAGADFSLPSVIVTQAHTNCGDRVQAATVPVYDRLVASRFANLSEFGDVKVERFTPAGGGTDNGRILAHVTVAHQMDPVIRRKLYRGNPYSFVSVNIDLQSHVGRLDTPTAVIWGRTKESPWREDRGACGAIIATLTGFNEHNAVHKRLRHNLGEENFEFLSKHDILLFDGSNIKYVVAAAIVAIEGLHQTAIALASEMDERGVGHITATLNVNKVSEPHTMIYLGRATVFQNTIKFQGFGMDATKYSGRMVDGYLVMTYDGKEGSFFPIEETHIEPVATTSTAH